MESFMAICYENSARGRSVTNTKSTVGRYDMESAEGMCNKMYAKGSCVNKYNTTGKCSFAVNKGDHYLETESAKVENTKNMTKESSEARSIAKSSVGSYIAKSAVGNFIAKPAVERMAAESTRERSIATKPTTRNIKVKTKNCLECAMRHIE